MALPDKPILERCFTEANWPDAIVEAIEIVGAAKGKHALARHLSDQWLVAHGGKDMNGVALWIRQVALKAGVA